MNKGVIKFSFCFVVGLIAGIALMLVIDNYLNKQEGLSAYYLASKYVENKEFDGALIPLSVAIAKLQDEYGPLYLAGKIYETCGNRNLALAMYQKALAAINNYGRDGKKENFDEKILKQKIAELEQARE